MASEPVTYLERKSDADVSSWIVELEVTGIIYVDIDRLMLYNDCFGHVQGDEVIEKVALVIVESLLNEKSKIARLGGDEFIVLMKDIPKNRALEIAEHIRQSVEALDIPMINSAYAKTYEYKNGHYPVTVSVGVITLTCPLQSDFHTKWLVNLAYEIAQLAKLMGRNRVVRVDA